MNDRFRFRTPVYGSDGKFKEFVFWEAPAGFPTITAQKGDVLKAPEQSTGLKDREGELIYEGDFLIDEYGTEFFVYWDKEGGVWKCREYGKDSSGFVLGTFRHNECLQIFCNTHRLKEEL